MRKQNLKKSNAFDVYYTNLGVYEGGARFTLFVGLPLQPLHTCTTKCTALNGVQMCTVVCKFVQICANVYNSSRQSCSVLLTIVHWYVL